MSLFLLLSLLSRGFLPPVLNNDRAVIYAAYDILNVVLPLELTLGEGALEEATLLVAQLPELVVSPDEERAIVESGHTVTATTGQIVDAQWLVLVHVNEA
jgi:hypothetical protein